MPALRLLFWKWLRQRTSAEGLVITIELDDGNLFEQKLREHAERTDKTAKLFVLVVDDEHTIAATQGGRTVTQPELASRRVCLGLQQMGFNLKMVRHHPVFAV